MRHVILRMAAASSEASVDGSADGCAADGEGLLMRATFDDGQRAHAIGVAQRAVQDGVVQFEFERVAVGHADDAALHRERPAEHGRAFAKRGAREQIGGGQQRRDAALLIDAPLAVRERKGAQFELVPMVADIVETPCIARDGFRAHLLRDRHAIGFHFAVRVV